MAPRVLEAGRDRVVIDLGFRGVVTSTAPLQPSEASRVAFVRVGDLAGLEDAVRVYRAVREELGEDTVVLLTSADLDKAFGLRELGEPKALVAASVGLKPPACPGGGAYEPLRLGTVNLVVAVDEGLEESGVLDLVRVASEAKCLAMVELNLKCALRSPGTVTDTVTVIARRGGYLNAGMATRIGGPVSLAVYELLVDTALKLRGPEEFLGDSLGLGFKGLVDVAVKAYSLAPVPGVDESRARALVERELRLMARDPNLLFLVAAARDAELRGMAGAIYGVGRDEFRRDPRGIIADELLAFATSLYLSGFKGLLAAYWLERLKEKGKIDLGGGVFLDDMVAAVAGSALSRVYDRLLGGGGGQA